MVNCGGHLGDGDRVHQRSMYGGEDRRILRDRRDAGRPSEAFESPIVEIRLTTITLPAADR